MVYEFKSRATANLLMMEPVAERILDIIGKSPGKTGIILPEQMGAAIAALKAAVERDRGTQTSAPAAPEPAFGDDRDRAPPVTLSQRAFPFIEMLQLAQAAGKEVTWGV
jgi:Domain of unknown function (DUF1840)